MQFHIRMTFVRLLLLGSLTPASIASGTAGKNSYKALYDFARQDTGEVDLHRGEIVTVLQENASGWWLVEKPDGSVQGWTPGSYLSRLSSSASSSKTSTSRTTPSSLPPSKFSSSTKTRDVFSSSTAIKQTTPSRSSTSIKSPTFPQPSGFTQPSSYSSSTTSSTKRAFLSSSASVNIVVPPLQTSRSPSPSLSFSYSSSPSTTPNFGRTDSTHSKTITNPASSPSSITLINPAHVGSPVKTSAIRFSNSTVTPIGSGLVDVNNSNIRELAASTGSSRDSPSSSRSAGATSSATPSNGPIDCQVNCGSTNSSLVNGTSQASPTTISSAPVPPQCADPGGVNGVTTACWNALNMTQYIKEWSLAHQGACHAQTTFAQCFLQILDAGMNDCISISSGTCPPPSWIQFKDHDMSVRDFYVAYNIYAVWTFFNSYYLAIGNARSAASDSIAGIIALLNPVKTNNAELANINFALSIGLSFFNLEGVAGPMMTSVIGVVLNSARSIPQIARYLFPGPPGDTKFVQLGQIANQMGTLTVNLQNNVATALSVIQNDTSTFLSFTGTGAFSNNPVVRMNQQSNSLLTALNTYVISLCLQANDWQISRAIDTDVNQLMTNGTQLTWNITDCGTGYNEKSMCGAYYWNKTMDVSYTLTNKDNMFDNPIPVMQQLFANWTTPQLLFDGASQCQMALGMGNPSISPTAGSHDITDAPCLSSVKMCTWDLNPDHFGTQYEYTDCDVQDHFATQGCSQCDFTSNWCTNVPSSYLGGYLLNPSAKAPQYTFCTDDKDTVTPNL